MVGGEQRFILLEHLGALGAGLGVQLLVQVPGQRTVYIQVVGTLYNVHKGNRYIVQCTVQVDSCSVKGLL